MGEVYLPMLTLVTTRAKKALHGSSWAQRIHIEVFPGAASPPWQVITKIAHLCQLHDAHFSSILALFHITQVPKVQETNTLALPHVRTSVCTLLLHAYTHTRTRTH